MVLYEQAGKILTKSDDPRYKLLFATQNLEVFDNKQTNKKQKQTCNKQKQNLVPCKPLNLNVCASLKETSVS